MLTLGGKRKEKSFFYFLSPLLHSLSLCAADENNLIDSSLSSSLPFFPRGRELLWCFFFSSRSLELKKSWIQKGKRDVIVSPPKMGGKNCFQEPGAKKIRMAEIVVQCKRMNLFLAFFYLYGEVSITEQQPTLSRICKKNFSSSWSTFNFPREVECFSRWYYTHTPAPHAHARFWRKEKNITRC